MRYMLLNLLVILFWGISLIEANAAPVDGVKLSQKACKGTKQCIVKVTGGTATKYKTIQQAIYAATNGDLIYVGPGKYEEQLEINKSDVTIVGENAKVFTKVDSHIINVFDSVNLKISGLHVVHELGGKECSQDCFVIWRSKNLKLSGNDINGSGWYGVRVISGDNIHIIGNKIHNCQAGIFYQDIKTIVIKDNAFYNNKQQNITSSDDGYKSVYMQSLDYIYWKYNNFDRDIEGVKINNPNDGWRHVDESDDNSVFQVNLDSVRRTGGTEVQALTRFIKKNQRLSLGSFPFDIDKVEAELAYDCSSGRYRIVNETRFKKGSNESVAINHYEKNSEAPSDGSLFGIVRQIACRMAEM